VSARAERLLHPDSCRLALKEITDGGGSDRVLCSQPKRIAVFGYRGRVRLKSPPKHRKYGQISTAMSKRRSQYAAHSTGVVPTGTGTIR
jgi:hypothetical protein